jgi:hypothetical protein
MEPPRSAPPVALRIVRPYASEDDLLAAEANAFTRTGVVLIGAPSRPVGVVLRFEILLAGGVVAMRGEGRVVGHRPGGPGEHAALMLRFTRLDVRSKALLDRAVALREGRSMPPPAAPSAVEAVIEASPPPPLAVASVPPRSEAVAASPAPVPASPVDVAPPPASATVERLSTPSVVTVERLSTPSVVTVERLSEPSAEIAIPIHVELDDVREDTPRDPQPPPQAEAASGDDPHDEADRTAATPPVIELPIEEATILGLGHEEATVPGLGRRSAEALEAALAPGPREKAPMPSPSPGGQPVPQPVPPAAPPPARRAPEPSPQRQAPEHAPMPSPSPSPVRRADAEASAADSLDRERRDAALDRLRERARRLTRPE